MYFFLNPKQKKAAPAQVPDDAYDEMLADANDNTYYAWNRFYRF